MGTVNWGRNTKFLTKSSLLVRDVLNVRSDWLGFLDALGKVEGENKYNSDNGNGYIGIYQFSKFADKYSLFKTFDFSHNIGMMLSTTSDERYKSNPIAQELSAIMEFSGIPDITIPFCSKWSYVRNAALGRLVGMSKGQLDSMIDQNFTIQWMDDKRQVVGAPQAIRLTNAGVSAAAHNLGELGVALAIKQIYLQTHTNTGAPISPPPTVLLNMNGINYTSAGKARHQGFADGNGIPFSTYVQLFQDFDISPLTDVSDGLNWTQFNQFAQQLIAYRKDKIINYLLANKQGVTMSVSTGGIDYRETARAVLQGLSLPTDKLNSVDGQVVLAIQKNSWFSNRGDLIFDISNADSFLKSGAGNDVIYAGAGKDTVVGGSNNDVLVGGDGDDTLIDEEGDDELDGGPGTDTYYVAGDSGHQRIIDDGLGDGTTKDSTFFAGVKLAGGDGENGIYTDVYGNTYRWSGNQTDLLISNYLTTATVTVEGFVNGTFGISLGETKKDEKPPLNPAPPKDPPGRAAAAVPVDPVILDLDGDGIKTTGIAEGVNFDYSGDGFTERTGWVSPDDGFLVLDRNGDGVIGEGSELFSDQTPLANGTKAWTGFVALAELDLNEDGVIDADDPAYAALRIWKDLDSDGKSEAAELFTLEELSIMSIATEFVNSNAVDSYGNEHRQHGSFTVRDGTVLRAEAVWFNVDQGSTIPKELLPVPDDIKDLPDLQGYGTIYDLRQAMVRDSTGQLKSLVEQFSLETDQTAREALMEEIILNWTDSNTIDPSSRGQFIDARKLHVVEAFIGHGFAGIGDTTNPIPTAAALLDQSYTRIFEMYYSGLILQTRLKELCECIRYKWDEERSCIGANLGLVTAELESRIANDPSVGKADLSEFSRALHWLIDVDRRSFLEFRNSFTAHGEEFLWIIDSAGKTLVAGTENADSIGGTTSKDSALQGGGGNDLIYSVGGNDVLYGNDGNDSLWGSTGDDVLYGGAGDDLLTDQAGSNILDGGPGSDSLAGGTGDDILLGRTGDDTLCGGYGDDELRGGAGNDSLFGGFDDDTLEGGEGDDLLRGGAGNDTYFFGTGSGNDTIESYEDHSEGNDTIQLREGIGLESLRISSSSPGQGTNLFITLNDTGETLTLNNFYQGSSYQLDDLRLADGSILESDDLGRLGNIHTGTADGDTLSGHPNYCTELYGLEGNDSLYGGDFNDSLSGGSENDLLSGLAGSDILSGDSGNDTLLGGNGDDIIDGGEGNDFLRGGPGDDTYLFGRGSGADTIDSYEDDNGYDSVQLGEGLTPDSLDFTIDYGGGGNNLVIRIKDTGETLTLNQYFDGEAYQTDAITFSDGLTLTPTEIQDIVIPGAGPFDDVSSGSPGDDILYGYYGNDSLSGGSGNDVLYGGGNNDVLFGEDGSDALLGEDGSDFLDGGQGNDVLRGGRGDDTYFFGLGSGNDTIENCEYFPASGDEKGHDVLVFGDGIALDSLQFQGIKTYEGHHLLIRIRDTGETLRLNRFLEGEPYQIEEFIFSDGTVLSSTEVSQVMEPIIGTGGNDIVYGFGNYGTNIGTTIHGEEGNDSLCGLTGYDILNGGPGDDVLYGNSGDDLLMGDSGSDKLFGENDNDILDGGPGDDQLSGGPGDDTYLFQLDVGYDTIMELNGNDTIQLGEGITLDSLEFSASLDVSNNLIVGIKETGATVRLNGFFDGSTSMITFIFADGTTLTDTDVRHLLSPVTGSAANDLIRGVSGCPNQIAGDCGDDSLYGSSDNDTLWGGEGSDLLFGDRGNDDLMGDAGDDSLYVGGRNDLIKGNEVPVVLFCGTGNDVVLGGGGFDSLHGLAGDDNLDGESGDDTLDGGSGNDVMAGGTGNDSLTGGTGNDNLSGNAGNDSLSGSAGYDILYGNDGNDTLFGEDGNDVLDGGGGSDVLRGGYGNDTYAFGIGYGSDTVENGEATTGWFNYWDNTTDIDTVRYGTGITPESLDVYGLFNGTERNLVVRIKETGDTLTFRNWFLHTYDQVDSFIFADDTSLPGIDLVSTARGIFGTDGNDTIDNINTGLNRIYGGLGNDEIGVYNPNATADGGPGDDTLFAYYTTDATLLGGEGNDSIYGPYSGSAMLDGGPGDDFIYTWNKSGSSITALRGDGNDIFDGRLSSGDNSYSGGEGNDTILGGTGNDTLSGDAGDDMLRGESGNDTIFFQVV